MFVGNLNDTTVRYAVFVTDSRDLGDLGLGTFSKQSLINMLENKDNQAAIYTEFINPCGVAPETPEKIKGALNKLKESLLGKKPDAEGNYAYYYEYNKDTNKYEKTGTKYTVDNLVDFWNNSQKDLRFIEENIDYRDFIYKVKNSLEGCLFFDADVGLSENIEEDVNNNTDGTNPTDGSPTDGSPTDGSSVDIESAKKTARIRVYFQSKDKAKNSREIFTNGDPKISTIPRRPSGGKYDFARTQKIQLKGIDNSNDENDQHGHIGRYKNYVTENEEVTDQKVASKLRLSYNQALGYFESGTQSLIARLLDDLPAPELREIDLEGVDTANFKDMYSLDGAYYMSQFTTGLALPLTVHQANPNTFGPNVIGKQAEYRKEKIRVVNRANSSFKANEVVMCSLIDNEWIVQGFGGAPAELAREKFSVGKWSFTKMIADSDAYFRDERWFGSDPDNTDYAFTIFENEYAILRRQAYYHHLATSEIPENAYGTYLPNNINDIQLIAKLNSILDTQFSPITNGGKTTMTKDDLNTIDPTEDSDIQPSRRYYQSTIFDQLGHHMGGNNGSGNIIGRTNRRINPDASFTFGLDLAEYATEVPLFWGPTFVDGYIGNQTKRLTKPVDFFAFGSNEFLPSGGILDITDKTEEKNLLGIDKTFMFYNERDTSMTQLPAEIALNASPSGENGYPIENLELLMRYEQSLNSNLPALYSDYFNDQERLSWIHASGDENNSLFDLKPNINTIVDFIPLSFPMAGNGDILTSYFKNNNNQYYKEYDTYNAVRACLKDGLEIPNLWGNMITRHEATYPGQSSAASLLKGRDVPEEYSQYNEDAGDKGITNNTISWDRYIHKVPRTGPEDAPDVFSNLAIGTEIGANAVGIIGARNTFSINEGGTINFAVDYYIGLNAQATIAGGNVNTFQLGFGVGTTITSFVDGIKQNKFPKWGTRDCRPSTLGHTSLFVSVFDHWPEENTIYDVRYFTPLHFCPGNGLHDSEPKTLILDSGVVISGEWNFDLPESGYNSVNLANTPRERSVDQTKYDVDFRVPTYAYIDDTLDNQPVPVDTYVDRYGTSTDFIFDEEISVSGLNRIPLRPIQEWRVNTVCRGMMINFEGGFRHPRRTIGVVKDGKSEIITSKGSGFSKDYEYTGSFGIKIKVKDTDADGGITGFELVDSGYGLNFNNFYNSYVLKAGTDTEDERRAFGYSFNVPSQVLGEKTANILFQYGKVYDAIYDTPYPKKHGTTLSLTPTSQAGDSGPITGRKVSSLTITEPSNDDQYDAFYFHVNDVTHVDLFSDGPSSGPYSFNGGVEQSNGRLQYVSLEISTA